MPSSRHAAAYASKVCFAFNEAPPQALEAPQELTPTSSLDTEHQVHALLLSEDFKAMIAQAIEQTVRQALERVAPEIIERVAWDVVAELSKPPSEIGPWPAHPSS